MPLHRLFQRETRINPIPANRFGEGFSQFTPVNVVVMNSHTCCGTAVGLNCSAVTVVYS